MARRPFILGLTGSIGTGKSTTSAMFAEAGVPVWDADAAVHRLYEQDASLIAEIGKLVPAAVVSGKVDRNTLKSAIKSEPLLLQRLESLVHPRVRADREAFIAGLTAPLVVLDIPLLFEVGAEAECDAVLVVTIPPEVQRERVLARGTMTAETLDMILSRQLPLAEKEARADYVIATETLESTRKAVHDLIAKLTKAEA